MKLGFVRCGFGSGMAYGLQAHSSLLPPTGIGGPESQPGPVALLREEFCGRRGGLEFAIQGWAEPKCSPLFSPAGGPERPEAVCSPAGTGEGYEPWTTVRDPLPQVFSLSPKLPSSFPIDHVHHCPTPSPPWHLLSPHARVGEQKKTPVLTTSIHCSGRV